MAENLAFMVSARDSWVKSGRKCGKLPQVSHSNVVTKLVKIVN